MPRSDGYKGPKEINYLFVDGGSLRGKLANVARTYFAGKTFTLDLRKLPRYYDKIFYYDALPVRERDEDESAYDGRIAAQREFLSRTASIDGIHVYEGEARRKRKGGLVQKKVDVMIAVDMLTHTFRRNMHKATLLTGDADFKPLIDALVQDGMFVSIWYPVYEASNELLNSADARLMLGFDALFELLDARSQQEFCIPASVNKRPEECARGDRIV